MKGFVGMIAAVSLVVPAVATLSGHYEGSVPFILDMNLIFSGDGTMNFDQYVNVAHQEIKFPIETISETASTVPFQTLRTLGIHG